LQRADARPGAAAELPRVAGATQGTQTYTFSTLQDLTVAATHVRNLDETWITIPRDRLRLRTMKYVGLIARKHGWVAPASLFVTIMVDLVTSTFHDAGLKADQWQLIFEVGAVASAVWLAFAVFFAFRAESVDGFINACMRSDDD
jgi:hypothetical protein